LNLNLSNNIDHPINQLQLSNLSLWNKITNQVFICIF
jgi:hypothetical protein